MSVYGTFTVQMAQVRCMSRWDIYVTHGSKRSDGADVPHSTLPKWVSECGTGGHAAAH